MKSIQFGIRASLKIAIALGSISLFIVSCNRSNSDPSATVSVEEQASQSVAANPETQPSDAEDADETSATLLTDTENVENIEEVEETEAEEVLTEPVEIIELPDFVDETEPNLDESVEELDSVETEVETREETDETLTAETRSIQEKPSTDVGNFDFQLRQVFLKQEIIDRASNKRLSAENADEPSSYLFVELDLKNNSDDVMWDSVLYTLECADGTVIDSAADVARVYRSNRNIKISSAISPGGKGLVVDAFLVPEYCLKSDNLNLIVSPVGQGQATIPLSLN